MTWNDKLHFIFRCINYYCASLKSEKKFLAPKPLFRQPNVQEIFYQRKQQVRPLNQYKYILKKVLPLLTNSVVEALILNYICLNGFFSNEH